MKEWNTPAVEELAVNETMHGRYMTTEGDGYWTEDGTPATDNKDGKGFPYGGGMISA